jgi:hypothetical protein
MTTLQPTLIAVGLHLEIDTDKLKIELSKYIPETEMSAYTFISVMDAGFMYGSSCNVGSWSGIPVSQEDMELWYAKHSARDPEKHSASDPAKHTEKASVSDPAHSTDRIGQDVNAYMTLMYRTPKIILLQGTIDGKYFAIIVSNMTKGTQTFFHKKNADRGEYGSPICIDRIVLTGKAYKHEIMREVKKVLPKSSKTLLPNPNSSKPLPLRSRNVPK